MEKSTTLFNSLLANKENERVIWSEWEISMWYILLLSINLESLAQKTIKILNI